MKKKLFLPLLTLATVLLFSFSATAAEIVDSGNCGGDTTWTLTDDGVLTVSGTEFVLINSSTFEPSILENVNTIVVNEGITDVVISSSSVKKISIPASVDHLDGNKISHTFYCGSLEEISVSDDNPYYCDIDGVLFSKDRTRLVYYPGGRSTVYEIPDGTKDIGFYAFSDCTGLQSVTFPKSIEEIRYNSFDGTLWLNNQGKFAIGNGILFRYLGNDRTVTIPGDVTNVVGRAFYGCDNVENVIFQSNVTKIGSYYKELIRGPLAGPFDDGFFAPIHVTILSTDAEITALWTFSEAVYGGEYHYTDVLLTCYPNSTAEAYAADSFVDITIDPIETSGECGENVTWNFDPSEKVLTISGNGPMNDYTSEVDQPWRHLIADIESVVISDGVTHIGSNSFSGFLFVDEGVYSYGLSELIIADSVTSIGSRAFITCLRLENIIIPSSVEVIKPQALGYSFTDHAFVFSRATIYGETSSAAEAYATENGIPFVPLEPEVPDDPLPIEPTEPEPSEPEPIEPTEPSEPKPELPEFTDLEKDAWYTDSVMWAVEKRITTGTSPTTFSPNSVCTRGQIVTFLWRAAGEPEPSSSNNPFLDVKSSDYFYKAVLWAVEQNITNGMSDTSFAPNADCTRGQVVTFLHRYAGTPAPKSSANPFTDVAKEYYYDAVLWAVEQGITNGMSDTTFAPNATCSRAQIVTFLYRYIN